jgi:hypothetical protein
VHLNLYLKFEFENFKLENNILLWVGPTHQAAPPCSYSQTISPHPLAPTSQKQTAQEPRTGPFSSPHLVSCPSLPRAPPVPLQRRPTNHSFPLGLGKSFTRPCVRQSGGLAARWPGHDGQQHGRDQAAPVPVPSSE